MLDLKLQTIDTAPEGSRDAIAGVNEAYGFVPNLIATLANAPSAVNAYVGIASALDESSLTPVEQQVVLLATSFENRCHYCMAAHSVVARGAGASDDVVDALREGEPIPDPRLEALRSFTTSVVRHRGWIPEEELDALLAAGFSKEQVLDVLTGVTLKTLSNYMNHITGTPLDDGFRKAEWAHPGEPVGATA